MNQNLSRVPKADVLCQQELIGGQDSVSKENFVSELWSSKFKNIFNKTKVSVIISVI